MVINSFFRLLFYFQRTNLFNILLKDWLTIILKSSNGKTIQIIRKKVKTKRNKVKIKIKMKMKINKVKTKRNKIKTKRNKVKI